MKLLKQDKKYLESIGYSENDFAQIEKASSKTFCEYYDSSAKKFVKIGAKKAIDLLGRDVYWSGMARSAFHQSACRETSDGTSILFDSSEFFKEQKGEQR